ESGTGSIYPSAYVYPNGEVEELNIDDTTFVVDDVSATGPNNGIVQMFMCVSTTSITDPNKTIDDSINNWTSYPPVANRSMYYQPNRKYFAWDSNTTPYESLIEDERFSKVYTKHFTYYKNEFYKCVL